MRGTLHFTAPEDLRWMLAIAHERQGTWAAKRRGDLGITDEELERAGRIAGDELSGGRLARRDALLAAFTAGGVPVDGQRAYHLLWNLGHRSLIVFGPPDGKQPTFALLDEWIGTHRDLSGAEALGEFARRYFIGPRSGDGPGLRVVGEHHARPGAHRPRDRGGTARVAAVRRR